MKKSNKSWIYATTVLTLALGGGTIVATAESPAAVSVSADTVAQESSVVSSAGSAVDAASSALTSAATSAAETGIPVTSSASNVSPSYTSTPSATSSAVSSANSANTSAYSSAASSAASYMSSQASSLSSVASSYGSVVSSYNSVANSAAAAGSLIFSDAGVSIYYQSNAQVSNPEAYSTDGTIKYYGYTVVGSQADIDKLLGAEYVMGGINWTDQTTITNLQGGTLSTSGTRTVIVPNTPGGTVSFTLTNVATANNGAAVNAKVTMVTDANAAWVEVGDGSSISAGSIWISDGNMNNASLTDKMTTTFKLVDAATGDAVNLLSTQVLANIQQFGQNYPTTPDGGSAGFSGLSNLYVLNPDGTGLVSVDSQNGTTMYGRNSSLPEDANYTSGNFGSLGFVGVGDTVTIESSHFGDAFLGNGLVTLDILPSAPSATINYVSVDKPVLYELVTPPKAPNTPATPGTPSTPAAPTTPATPMAATKAMPLATKVSNTLPETGDAAGSTTLMYGGFALLGALTFAGVMTRKRRKLLEANKKAAEAASEL